MANYNSHLKVTGALFAGAVRVAESSIGTCHQALAIILVNTAVTLVAFSITRTTGTVDWTGDTTLGGILIIITNATVKYTLSCRIEVGPIKAFYAHSIVCALETVRH
jgi:hypothetical protein